MRLLEISLLIICSFAVIPQIKLCAGSDEDCRTVSRIGLGTLAVGQTIEGKRDMRDPEAVAEWLEAAAALGYNFLDMADVYPIKRTPEENWRTSVPIIGQAFALREGLREKFYINCKMAIEDVNTNLNYLPIVDISVDYIEGQIEWFREQLNVETLDSVMIHMPETLDFGHSLDNDAMAQMFKSKKDAGHALHFGVANWNIDQFSKFEEALNRYDISLTSLQVEINVWSAKSAAKYNDYMFDHGKTIQGWSAVAGEPMGDLNRVFEATDGNILNKRKRERINENLEQIAKSFGTTKNVVALSFVLRSGSHVLSLIGTTNVTRLEQLSMACDYVDKWTDDLWLTVASDAGIDCDKYLSECYELPPLDQVSTSLQPSQPPTSKTEITECSTCTCVDPGTTPYELGIRTTNVIDLTQATFCEYDQYFFHDPTTPMMGTSGVGDTSDGHYYANTTIVVEEGNSFTGCHTLEAAGLQSAPAPQYYVNPNENCQGHIRPSANHWTDIRLDLDFKKVENKKSDFLALCTKAIGMKGVTCDDARSGSTIIHITSNNQTDLQKARNKIDTEGLKLDSEAYGNTVFIKRDPNGAGFDESSENDKDIDNEAYIAGIVLLTCFLICAVSGMYYFYHRSKKIQVSATNGAYGGMN